MTEQIIEPNDFDLHNNDVQIHYSLESFIGGPQLTYKTQNFDRQFTGEEINVVETNIGKLVTVLVEPDADTGEEVRLTLLLPSINLSSSLENPIETEAIFTTQRNVLRGLSPILEGQLQTYHTLSLRGTARSVDF
ncbi:hypothetical protein [Nostoc sp. FACHB-110]|uniref:hypothetical protein n=1 Tax=Nostoc sp. FACHB-110 TaxID=2692834 RepID=UPI001682F928|nr:hypothetical protein [Nostoc sp. FACHB-110]MBD2440870.1 hypothetical protein [Nostoc sp. FACHB-110]